MLCVNTPSEIEILEFQSELELSFLGWSVTTVTLQQPYYWPCNVIKNAPTA